MFFTRKVWLLGQKTRKIVNNNKLPSICEVLKYFFHLHLTEQRTISESANTVANDVLVVWRTAHLPTQSKPKLVQHIKRLFKEWK